MKLPHIDRTYSVNAMKMCVFLKNVAQLFAQHSWLRFCAAYLDARPIGVLFSFQFVDRIYLYNAGFDPDFSHLSPGIVAIGLDIKTAIDEGFKYYDFLRGEENYKRQFGAQKRSTMRIMR
jgi:CelD/BcsL family acetyltransferase involved in cellulose biosynthesis